MPRGDKTGPDGDGPKTGRGLGNCTDTKKTTTKKDSFGGWERVIPSGRKGRGGNRNGRK